MISVCRREPRARRGACRGTASRARAPRGTKGTVGSSPPTLGFTLLLRLKLFAEDCGDLPLHERPRNGRVGQRALLSARTVNLKTTTELYSTFSLESSITNKNLNNQIDKRNRSNAHLWTLLSLDGVPGAGEAELVVRLAGALHEVRVFEALLAQRALEQRRAGRRRRVRALARLGGRHRRRRRHVPGARRPPPAVRPCRTWD